MLLPIYLSDYLNHCHSKGLKPSSLKQYSSDLQKFIAWLDKFKGSIDFATLESITGSDLEHYIEYLSKENLSDATFRRLLSVLNRFFLHYNIDASAFINKSKERPLRPLNKNDFILNDEMQKLLNSMKKPTKSEARNHLIDRNIAIILLARYYGFTPKDISSIKMNLVNFQDRTITLPADKNAVTVTLKKEHFQYILDYRNTIDKHIRPRYWSKDPLFVAFFNITRRFLFDYAAGKPKTLSIRAIQEMIKDEVEIAELRKMSAKHLRNSCILDHLLQQNSVQEVISYFRLSDSYSIHRYQIYLNNNEKLYKM